MELPKFGRAEGGMLDGLKSKLGFQSNNDQGYDDEYYDDGYEDYADEYGDYGEYGDDYAEEPVAPARPSSRSTSRTSASSSRRSGAAGAATSAKLVSIDDVRARTQVPESLSRDPLPPRRVTSASSPSRIGRNVVDSSLPYSMTPEGTAAIAAAGNGAAAARRSRSEGLDSLFEPSASPASASSPAAASSAPSSGVSRSTAIASAVPAVGSAASAAPSFDPYEAYAGAGARSYSASRSVTVLKPASYGEVERVAKAVKAGDAVVLALRNTPDELSKRILDFSFGVSAALDANVDCVGDKAFAITRGAGLTDAEREGLRSQGVL